MYHKHCSKICGKFSEVQQSVIVCRCVLPPSNVVLRGVITVRSNNQCGICVYISMRKNPPLLFFCRCCQLHCVTMATAPNDSWQS